MRKFQTNNRIIEKKTLNIYYSKVKSYIRKVETLPNRKNSSEALIIDVTEQSIEDLVKGQKLYYFRCLLLEAIVLFQLLN